MPLLILVAEDDPGISLSVQDYLEQSGYSVICAGNAKEAVNLLETYHPHLLISDIKMPGEDGYSLVKKVRQRPEFRLLPVLFLTEKNSPQDRILGYQSGCDVYLAKPFLIEELGAVVRNLLERAQIIQTELRFPISTGEIIPQVNFQKKESEALQLTSREQDVLNLLSKGFSNIEIGNHLYLSPKTIEKYVSSLLRKTETTNRAELLRYALEHKLVDFNQR